MIRSVRIIAKNKEERDIFLIPPNFLNEGSLFGGMLKLRNTLEAVVLVVGVTIPILKITVFCFTAKIILLCLTALPICILLIWGWWRKPDSLSYELLPFPAEQENAVSFGCHAGAGEK